MIYARESVSGQESSDIRHRRAQLIRYWMELAGMGSKDVALLVGVGEREVQRWISGQHTPSEANMQRLADLMGVPVVTVRQPPFPRSPYPELEKALGPEGLGSLRQKALGGRAASRPRLRRPKGTDDTRQ